MTKPESFREYPAITSLIDDLPWHKDPNRRWEKRSNPKVSYIVVHQAAADGTLQSINNYHISPSEDRDHSGVVDSWERNHISPEGCPHICYHYGIPRDGNVFQLNEEDDVTWHVKGYNQKALGILVVGNFSGPSYKSPSPNPNPSPAQVLGLHQLINWLISRPEFENATVVGHNQLDPTNKPNCPGLLLSQYVQCLTHDRDQTEAERFLGEILK